MKDHQLVRVAKNAKRHHHVVPERMGVNVPKQINQMLSEQGLVKLTCHADQGHRCGIMPDKSRSRCLIDEQPRLRIRELCEAHLPWPAFFTGVPGSGKTCAALSLCDAATRATVYHTLPELAERLHLATYGDLREDDGISARPVRVYPGHIWRPWKESALAVMDEIGTRGLTDSQRDTLQRAIDYRDGLPLIVISNLSLTAIADLLGDRVASRLAGGTVVDFGEIDRRVDGARRRRDDAQETISP